jgi:hypothetical protein
VQGGAEPIVADVAFDHVGDRRLEEHFEGFPVSGEQLGQRGPIGRVPDPDVTVAAAKGPPNAAEELDVGAVPLDVSGSEGPDGGRASIRILPQGDRAPVFKRTPQVGVDHRHLVSAPAQVELVHDQRVEQPHQIGARADAPGRLREWLLNGACATELIPTFEHQHGPAGSS